MTHLLPTCFWYDGDLVQAASLNLEIDQPGLIYGATVFTTLRVHQNSMEHPLTNWAGHRRRLQSSLQSLGWRSPQWGRILEGVNVLKEAYPVLRITVFPDGREWITGRLLPSDLQERQRHGVLAWLTDDVSRYQRSLPSHKTGNYLGCWLAMQAARQRGAAEAILRNDSGNWLETSTGNLWGWSDGHWRTPPLESGILPGLARAQLIQGLELLSQSVIETPWTPQQVLRFEAIAYSNSVVQLIPIHTILDDGTKLEYSPYHKSFEILWAGYLNASGAKF
ncbi:MAG: aminotransferase class IV [Leptolyngbyaceae cyanobacterium MO_188.B28]|nr:aminotransferase class IV [Leptolyngbyaceae cyanobacterium MO_188.B28]